MLVQLDCEGGADESMASAVSLTGAPSPRELETPPLAQPECQIERQANQCRSPYELRQRASPSQSCPPGRGTS